MATTTLASLRQQMQEDNGDFWHSTVTTALAASASLIDTALQGKRNTADYFNRYWALATSENNAPSGVAAKRKVSDDDGTSTLTVLTNWLTDGANLATYELLKYDPDSYIRALNIASRELHYLLKKRKIDDTLVTGNALPNASFEDQTTTGTPDLYTLSSVTGTKTTTAGLYWGPLGTTSVKLAATATDGYMYITSNDYPKLLDLMGHSVSFKCPVYPQDANDLWIQIYTVQADGTKQYLPQDYADEQSTAGFSYAAIAPTAPATAWTLLEAENQQLNDDLVEVQFRFGVHTDTKYGIFDSARATGKNLYHYLLPTPFYQGRIDYVGIQTQGTADDMCDDRGLVPNWEEVFGWRLEDDGTYKYLRLPYLYGSPRAIRLKGDTPLEDTLSADTDTLSLAGPRLTVFLAYANYKLFEILKGVSSHDTSEMEQRTAEYLGKFNYLKSKLARPIKSHAIKWTIDG